MRVPSFCLLLVFAASACGFEAPPPKRTPPPPQTPPPVSEVTATLKVPVAAIIAALNDKTRTELADIKDKAVDCVVAKCQLDLVATRTGAITGRAANGRLSIDVPLAATAQLELKTALFKTRANSLATGAVHADTAIALGPDWHLKTDTQGRVDLSQAQLKLGPIKMNFADIWNRNQESLSAPLFKSLDRHVATELKIKPQAERLWSKVQRPIRIGKSPAAWLVLEPDRIRVSPLLTKDDAMIVSMAVDVRARVVVADAPPALAPGRGLPAPSALAAPSDRFAFFVPVLLPYGEASALAMKHLANMPIRLSGGHVRFEKIEILPSGKDVVVATRFCVAQSWDPFGWFDSCGEGYLRGTPVFDAATRTIRIDNMHYDIATEDMLLTAMRWLAGDELGKALQTKLVFNVGHDIENLDTELKTALAKPQGRGVSVTAAVDSFGAPSLTWTSEGFLATFPASGTIRADLNLKPGTLDIR